MPPKDFSFDGPEYQQKLAHDHWNYRQKLQNSIPTVVCCVCNQLTAEIKCNQSIFSLNHKIFNKLFESTERENRYSRTSANGIEDSFHSRYVVENALDEYRICTRCHTCLKKNTMPKLALANRLDFGEIPEELKGLNLKEQRMISPYICTTTIIKMNGFGQKGTIGGAAHFMNDVSSWAKVLPRHPANVKFGTSM